MRSPLAQRSSGSIWNWRQLSPLLIPAALMGILAVIEPRFLTSANLMNILLQASPLALAAMGQAVVIISGELDLSQGSAAALAGVIAVLLAIETDSVAVGWIAILVVSVILGAVNGFLVTQLRIPSFVATVGMLTYADGMAYLITGGLPVDFPPDGYSWLGRGYIGSIPVSVLFVAVVAVAMHIFASRTRAGRALYLIGDNANAAVIVGIRPSRYRFYAFLLAGLLTGSAALILTGRIDSAPPTLSATLPFEAIAAVAIGGIAMTGGEGAVWRAVAGVAPIAILVNGLNLLGVNTYIQLILIGAITIAVVALQNVQQPLWFRWRVFS